jgi:hypothetical protein
MNGIRLAICAVGAVGFGAVTYLGIGHTGLADYGAPTGGLYSNLIIYPAVILMGCFGFYIVFAATDRGSGK